MSRECYFHDSMGTFNTLENVRTPCPSCRVDAMVRVQFRFGSTRQHLYRVGDVLRWTVESSCHACGFDGDWNVYVFIDDDRIRSVSVADGSVDFLASARTYREIDAG